jgi:hypothetical protein
MLGSRALAAIASSSSALVFFALLWNVFRCFKNSNPNRYTLVASCACSFTSNACSILVLSGYWRGDVAIASWIGGVTYNAGMWSCRIYACNRMGRLVFSPSLSSKFRNLSYSCLAFAAAAEAAYVSNAAEYYRTRSPETVVELNLTTIAVAIVADLIFDLSNAYLHLVSLRSIPDESVVKCKLYVMSYSTMVSTGFSLTKLGLRLAGDAPGGIVMAMLEVASLPAAVTLGEIVSAKVNPRRNLAGSYGGASKTAGDKNVRGNSVSATDGKNSEGVR